MYLGIRIARLAQRDLFASAIFIEGEVAVQKKTSPSTRSLLDAVRPTEADGPLQSVVLATYGLSLEQPNFFEHDFLPTLLGLGGIRDRGYVAPVTLERKLADTYCALICDAHALAEGGRPSLRIDVIPVARPRHHAKVLCIHRKRLVRFVVTSANLTHDGYRSQREVAAVLDFRPEGMLSGEILRAAVDRWIEVLGDAATPPIRQSLEAAVATAREWSPPRRTDSESSVRVVFGGTGKPLWQEVVEAWPDNEPLLSWQICSPFWPAPEAKTTPFDVIAHGLQRKGASLAEAVIEIICSADAPGDRARPVFPFPVLHGLREREFPIQQGRIVPARLDTLEEEVPDRKAEGQRALHAKWMILRGSQTAVVLLGSANFTNPGLGVNPQHANIEAGILFVGSVDDVPEDGWLPPLVDSGSIDWATCASREVVPPASDPDDPLEWPVQIRRIDLDIHWEHGPAPNGTLRIEFVAGQFVPTILASPDESPGSPSTVLLQIDQLPADSDGHASVVIDAGLVSRLLVHRAVRVSWDEPARRALFPINILESAKAGLPSILGARPDEQQLLAYFHGRIGEDDLLLVLEKRALESIQGNVDRTDESPSVELQNYLIREFVESLFGLQDMLAGAMFSPRALEQALLGDFSPASLGERIVQAYLAGRRSATATAFQLTELLRVVGNLAIPPTVTDVDRGNLQYVKDRALLRLLSLIRMAGHQESFADACGNSYFEQFVRSSLPKSLAGQFFAIMGNREPDASNPATFVPTEGADT